MYRLLDSGNGEKLEQIAGFRVRRQAAQAFWDCSLSKEAWQTVDATHVRSKKGGGYWDFHRKLPPSWIVEWGGFQFKAKLTPFGHIGLFPEQADNWSWLKKVISERGELEVLNLFAYTGGSTLACAQAGARVTHLDASKGVVSWARENAGLNNLSQKPVRWIVDDVVKFVKREIRRGRNYQGLILDPPTYGRGNQGETWKIEDDLLELLKSLKKLTPNLQFMLLSCHSPGFSGLVLSQMMRQVFNMDSIETGEMVTASERMPLPSGVFSRWSLSCSAL